MAKISIENVVKRYDKTVALKGLSLSVGDGEFVSLLGPSGCGKTTLLRAIAGLEEIQSGSIMIGDRVVSTGDYTMLPEERNLGLVFQSYALWPHMTVASNVSYSLKVRSWERSRMEARVSEVLELVGLGGFEQRYPSQLSGGQMQRVALARSLAPEPQLLLFDEPLSNLDSVLREQMRYELREIQHRVGTTAIYVTHDQHEAMVMSDRIILMDHGLAVQDDTPRRLYQQPFDIFAAKFLGVQNLLEATVVGLHEPTNQLPGNDTTGRIDLLFPALDGLSLRGAGSVSGGSSSGRQVTVAIRGEDIRLSLRDPGGGPQASDDANVFRGQVEEVIFAGALVDVFLRVSDQRLRARLLPYQAEAFRPGQDVWLVIDIESVRVVGRRDTEVGPADAQPSEPGKGRPEDAHLNVRPSGPTQPSTR